MGYTVSVGGEEFGAYETFEEASIAFDEAREAYAEPGETILLERWEDPENSSRRETLVSHRAPRFEHESSML